MYLDGFSEFNPEVDEVPIRLSAMWESDDEIDFEKWSVAPNKGRDEEGEGKLNEKYYLHF